MNTIGVSQKAIIFNEDRKILTLFRTETAPTRPNAWDLPGGDLDFGEDAIEGIIREVKEETGLLVKDLKPFDVASFINSNGDFWITIAYCAYTTDKNVKLSYEHNKFRWVTTEEFLAINTSRNAERFVKNLVLPDFS